MTNTTELSDFVGVAAGMRARWPHAELPESTITVWHTAVADLPLAQIEAAVEVFYREGREFPPNGGQIRQKVIELAADAPQWGEVWRALRKAQMKAPALSVDPDHRADHLRDNGLAAVAEFIESVGWPEADEWTDDNLESRLRRKWEEWLRDRKAGATNQGIPSAGLARLERGDGPRKLPASAVADAIARPHRLPPAGSGGPSASARAPLTVLPGGGEGGRGPQL